MGGGKGGVEGTTSFRRPCIKAQRRSTAALTQYHCWFHCHPHSHEEEGSQTEKGSGFHPAFKKLQGISHARVQLECELAQKAWGLARKYNNQWIKLARKYERQ